MNVFASMYSPDMDEFDREYAIAEATLMIDIERANKDYMFESGLINTSTEDTFLEATKKKPNENVFSKFVKNICDSMRKFITKLSDVIANMFGNNRITETDIKNREEEIKIRRDLEELDRVTQSQINEGNKLLKKVSSSPNGISDSLINTWIEKSTTKLAEVAPKYIKMGVALGIKDVISSKLKKNKDSIKNTEDSAKSSGNETDKQKNQKRGILNHISKLFHKNTDELYSIAKDIDKSILGSVKSDIKSIDKRAKGEITAKRGEFDDALNRYKTDVDSTSDSEFLSSIDKFMADISNIKKKANADKEKKEQKAIEKSCVIRLTRIAKDKVSNSDLDKSVKEAYLDFINRQVKRYDTDQDTADKFTAAIEGLLKKVK